MSGKRQELSPDIVLKNYWNNNERFADLFNGALFAGEQIIRPEELGEVDTEESTVLEHKKYVESVKAFRDNNLVLHNANNRDLFNLLEILLHTKTPRNDIKEKAIKYSEEHKTEKHVIMTVAGATNTKLDYNSIEEGKPFRDK